VQVYLPVVTGPAPGAPQLEDGTGGPLPVPFMPDSQPWGLRAAAALLQQPYVPLHAQKQGASSGISRAVSKENPAAAAGCYESYLGCAAL